MAPPLAVGLYEQRQASKEEDDGSAPCEEAQDGDEDEEKAEPEPEPEDEPETTANPLGAL
eukprot:COSAG04_NODE_4852_length_1861_cov_1.948922_2_plen_60_part_00